MSRGCRFSNRREPHRTSATWHRPITQSIRVSCCFLLAPTPSVFLRPRHSFPFSPAVCDNAARKSRRFSWISRNHRPKDGLSTPRRSWNVKCVKLDPELPPLTTVWIQFPSHFASDFAPTCRPNVYIRIIWWGRMIRHSSVSFSFLFGLNSSHVRWLERVFLHRGC